MAIQASSVVLCAANSPHEMRRSSDDLDTEVGEDGSPAKAEPLVTAACESWWHMTVVDEMLVGIGPMWRGGRAESGAVGWLSPTAR